VVVVGEAADGRYVVTTPCGREATISTGGGTKIFGVQVVIDPGHGGSVDTGAVQNGIIERDLNLKIAGRLQSDLWNRGISVILTRTANYGQVLSQRAAIADAVGATLLVSIHHNSSVVAPATSSSPGAEVYVQGGAESQRLGRLLYDEVTSALSANYSLSWYRAVDAGVLRVTEPGGDESYGMIKRPSTPTALIELGWISNPAEATVYKQDQYVGIAVDALGDAIEAYLSGASSSTPVGGRTFTAGFAPGTSRCTDPPLE
jgi:N-acetylmuramoyl-L-alanine amidase